MKFPDNFLPSAVLFVPKLPETVYYCFWVLRICFSLYCVLRLKTVVKKFVKKFRTKLWHWSWLENQTLRKKLTAKLNFKIKLVFSSTLKFELSFTHRYDMWTTYRSFDVTASQSHLQTNKVTQKTHLLQISAEIFTPLANVRWFIDLLLQLVYHFILKVCKPIA